MKTELLLIRHGETEWNKIGKFQGSTDIDLSEEGRSQAKLLRERIQNDFDSIYASPLSRAYETAEIIAAGSGKKIIIANDIREINFGEWEGLTIKDISTKYSDVFISWKKDKLEGKFIGGDLSTANAAKRAKNCILDIVKKNKGNKIIIVAHGGIIKAGIIGLFNFDMSMYHKISMGNTCINTIVFDDNLEPTIYGINDISHLKNEVKYV